MLGEQDSNIKNILTKAEEKKEDVFGDFFERIDKTLNELNDSPENIVLPLNDDNSFLTITRKEATDEYSGIFVKIENATDVNGKRFSTKFTNREGHHLTSNEEDVVTHHLSNQKMSSDEKAFTNFIVNFDFSRDINFDLIRKNPQTIAFLKELGVDVEAKLNSLEIKNGAFDDLKGEEISRKLEERFVAEESKQPISIQSVFEKYFIPEGYTLRNNFRLEVPGEIIEGLFHKYYVSNIGELIAKLRENPPEDPLFSEEDLAKIIELENNKNTLKRFNVSILPNHALRENGAILHPIAFYEVQPPDEHNPDSFSIMFSGYSSKTDPADQ